MQNEAPKISVVFPVFNEEDNLEILYQKVKKALLDSNVDYEMVFVDNGSTDESLNIIKGLTSKDPKVVFISLSRNFGHQNALFAGMSYTSGDAVITMDADLQHPPSLIGKMIKCWSEGYDVIYTVKKDYKLPFVRLLVIKTFYWLISKISRIQLNLGQSDFRLLDKKVVNEILRMPEYHKFLRGQVSWVGFKQHGLAYKVEERHSGISKFSYANLFSFALDGIFAFSKYPLQLMMLFGIIVAGVSLIYLLLTLLNRLSRIVGIFPFYDLPPGWLTLTVSVFFLGSMQLIAIAIIGEYIGRTYDQTKGRPIFIVKETSGRKTSSSD